MAFPADVPTWDPNARSLAAVQSLYKMVFDQPITQNARPHAQARARHKWGYVDDKGLDLELDLRSDVVFHDGSKMTAEDSASRSSTAPACRFQRAAANSTPPSSGAGSRTSRSSRRRAS